MKLKACIPGLLIILERAIVGKIDFSHYLKILVPQDVHFTLEMRPRENAKSENTERHAWESRLGNLCFYITLDAVKVQQVDIRTTNLTIIKAKMQKNERAA